MPNSKNGGPSTVQLKKRPATAQHPEGDSVPQKIAKIHPFFSKSAQAPIPSGPFHWLEPLGSTKSCLHAVNMNPKSSCKVAAFDLDGTLIKSGFTTGGQWEWWRANVPAKLQELHESGYAIVVLSNQALKPGALKEWKQKVSLIAATVPSLPFRLFAATEKDFYRKPMPGMWRELERIFSEQETIIDKTTSFFVGDAAGRCYQGRKADFASTDRKFALNLGLPFFTPEEYFLKLPTHTTISMPGFHVSTLPESAHITPTSSPLLPTPRKQEVVLFVGYPCLGKSTFFHRYFEPAGYAHVNQDTLKTRDKCVKAVETFITDGKSCVVDNTNRNIGTRKYYVDIAKKLGVGIRCFFFTGSIDLAWHNNIYRAYILPPLVAEHKLKRELLPYMAFTSFRDGFEEPTIDEGFTEIKNVNWVFEGTKEEREQWSMWLQIHGK